jgi:hypothetical protein
LFLNKIRRIFMYNQLLENAREKVHAYITRYLDSEKDKQ